MRGETGRGMRGSRGGVTHLTQNRAKIKCYFCNELAKFAVGSHLRLAEPDVLLGQHLTGCEASVCECVCECACVQRECSILLGVSSSPFYPFHNEHKFLWCVLFCWQQFCGNYFVHLHNKSECAPMCCNTSAAALNQLKLTN